MNFGFSGEMIFIFFLALILFGPKKLPEIGRTIGRFMNEFRRASNEFRSQIESEINNLDAQSKPQILPPSREPLGSLASRIFNPPAPEKLEAAEPVSEPSGAKPIDPVASVESSTMKVETWRDPSQNAAAEEQPASTPATKAAPDA